MSAKHTDAELECCEEHIVHTDAVMAARSAMPAEEITTAASDFFKAFSDKTRLRILAALVSAELCVCDIASLLNMSQSAISHQLRFLKQARLVKSRKPEKQYTMRCAMIIFRPFWHRESRTCRRDKRNERK